MRRIKRMSLSPEAMVLMAMHGARPVRNSLPSDAVVTGCFYDGVRNVVDILVSSSTYAPIYEGDMIPLLPAVWFERLE